MERVFPEFLKRIFDLCNLDRRPLKKQEICTLEKKTKEKRSDHNRQGVFLLFYQWKKLSQLLFAWSNSKKIKIHKAK